MVFLLLNWIPVALGRNISALANETLLLKTLMTVSVVNRKPCWLLRSAVLFVVAETVVLDRIANID